ncbi:MAG TPA: adenosylcobinamide-GDP ribazoletransferase, partial [Victivallales bacterium]|nr:adenosylcobinamide-GDP ribazoletransferase [Victivallales bacterium]
LFELFVISSLIITVTVINTFYWFFLSRKMITGITGDILGAVSETTETSLFFLSVIIQNLFFK